MADIARVWNIAPGEIATASNIQAEMDNIRNGMNSLDNANINASALIPGSMFRDKSISSSRTSFNITHLVDSTDRTLSATGGIIQMFLTNITPTVNERVFIQTKIMLTQASSADGVAGIRTRLNHGVAPDFIYEPNQGRIITTTAFPAFISTHISQIYLIDIPKDLTTQIYVQVETVGATNAHVNGGVANSHMIIWEFPK